MSETKIQVPAEVPEVPTEIANLLWDGVPADSEHQTASELHNTLILAAYLRGLKAGAK